MTDVFERAQWLSGRDFHRYLVDKGVSLVCPSCASDDLTIMADGPGGPLHVVAMPVSSPLRLHGTEVALLTLACRHCGQVRHFHAIDVLDWKDQANASAT